MGWTSRGVAAGLAPTWASVSETKIPDNSAMRRQWGWAGSAAEFLQTPKQTWARALVEHCEALTADRPSSSQRLVWSTEHHAMAAALRTCVTADPAAQNWGVVFEYELPLEGGRRPDVVVLAGETIVVLEFKERPHHYAAHFDQVDAYARDLAEYHEASHGRRVVPVLVFRDAGPVAGTRDGTILTDPDGIDQYLMANASKGSIDLQEWLDSAYVPLPTLVEAARQIFRHEPLPHVKRAVEADIPGTLELIDRLIASTEGEGTRALVFVTGVPGSGKTLLGLRVVYERPAAQGRAIFLSGNGPLVRVLQDALSGRNGRRSAGRAFVRDLHQFIKTYGMGTKTPREHVIVFDEAQRAWDGGYMETKRGVTRSEPDLLVEAGARVEEWALLLGLVGEGQEIHSGEEGGLAQWREAAKDGVRWRIYCPPRVADDFSGLDVVTHERLDLDVSLRSRRLEQHHTWVRLLLEGSLALAARQATRVSATDGWAMYVTRDLDEAKRYLRSRYAEEPGKRYGLVASSHARNLAAHGVRNSFLDTRTVKEDRWFNAEEDGPLSSNALEVPVTEFGCQGLELDMPIVCWGTDYRWDGRRWEAKAVRRKYPLADPEQIVRNAYRVLLTRGRDGFVVFLSSDEELEQTEHALLASGIRPLPEPMELGAEVLVTSTDG